MITRVQTIKAEPSTRPVIRQHPWLEKMTPLATNPFGPYSSTVPASEPSRPAPSSRRPVVTKRSLRPRPLPRRRTPAVGLLLTALTTPSTGLLPTAPRSKDRSPSRPATAREPPRRHPPRLPEDPHPLRRRHGMRTPIHDRGLTSKNLGCLPRSAQWGRVTEVGCEGALVCWGSGSLLVLDLPQASAGPRDGRRRRQRAKATTRRKA